MKEVKIYTIVSDQLSPPITGESFCTDMVRHSDYAELEDKERVSMGFGRDIIRATDKAKKLRCYRCSYGRVIDKRGQQGEKCPHCDGGVIVNKTEGSAA